MSPLTLGVSLALLLACTLGAAPADGDNAPMTTRVFIVRHGKAEKQSASGKDRDRRLRERGEKQARWVGARIAEGFGEGPEGTIVTSGYVRAESTAKLVNGPLGWPLRVETQLQGGSVEDVEAVIARELKMRGGKRAGPIVIVGHNPQLEEFVAAHSKRPFSAFRTGEAAAFDVRADGSGELVFAFVERARIDEEADE